MFIFIEESTLMKQVRTDKASIEVAGSPKELADGMRLMEMHSWQWDMNEQRLTMSPELMFLLGYDESEFDSGLSGIDRNIHPEDVGTIRQRLDDFLAGASDVLEIELRFKSGESWAWYYARGGIVQRSEQGKPEIIGGVLMDISRRYKGLMARVEEGNKFEFIFRNTREAVLILAFSDDGNKGKILEANEAAENLFGGKLKGRDPYELLGEEYMGYNPELNETFQERGTLELEMEIRDLEGKIKYLDVHAHSYNYSGENLFITIVTDKTESHQVQEELRASEAALRQSEKIYSSLIQAADDRIGMFRTDGTPVMLNNAFSGVLGFTNEEFMQLADRERIHPEDKQMLEKKASQLFRERFLATEYRVQHRDGHYLHMNAKSVLLKDPELEHDYVLMIIRDITEKTQFEKELITAKEKAEESDLLKSAFLANMSHEIRTPMNSIVGFANLLSEENLDEETRKEYIERVNRNSEQLLALISDIIDLAKIESNLLSVQYSSIYLENLFKDLVNFGEQQLRQRNRKEITLVYDPDPGAPEMKIESDLIRITQILQNLVNNAVKFTRRGTITIGYRLQDNATLRFFVKDTGTGIDRENFDIIFDQFRQLDGSNIRKYGGTGLGLAICRNLAALLKGKIWVESEMGTGSEFYVEIPYKAGSTVLSSKSDMVKQQDLAGEIRVLLVDDDPDNLLLLKTLLRNEGFQALTADSGYRALEILDREVLPDLVLLDLQMPVMSGLQTLQIIREKYPGLKVAGQSAYALDSEQERTMMSEFDAYITKPYDRNALFNMIGKLIAD